MIKVTRFSGEPLVLNAEMITYVEARPDTYIALQNGEKLIVRESMDEVLARAVEYHRTKHMVPPARQRRPLFTPNSANQQR